jgi:hypothetical protein
MGLLLSGNLIALVLLHGDIRLWLTVWRQVIKNGLPAIVTTFSLLIVAMLLSRTLAAGAWFLMKCMGEWFQKTGFWLGIVLSLFPIHALAWAFIGLWAGLWGFPIWSLMPVSADVKSLSFSEHLSRDLWTWGPAILVLCVPLIGQWLVILSTPEPFLGPEDPSSEEAEKSLATPHLTSPERVPGRAFKKLKVMTRNSIPLRASKRVMIESKQPVKSPNPVWGIGLLALIFLFSIEDILGLPGAMAKLVQVLRTASYQEAAMPVLMVSCVAVLGTLCGGSPILMMPETIRCGFSRLFKGASWIVVIGSLLAISLGFHLPLMPQVDSEMVFSNPLSALYAGLPPMLCALSLWLLGHMIHESTTR